MQRRELPRRRHACGRCVQLKVKCDLIPDSYACKRCTRLGQTCIFPDSPRANKPRKSRIDALQEQLDNVVAELKSNKQQGKDTYAPTTIPTSATKESSCLSRYSSTRQHDSRLLISDAHPNMADDKDPISRGYLTLLEADKLLAKFRSHKMAQFPFVMLPESADATTLRQQSPFLLLCILTACLEHDAVLQNRMEHEIREIVAARVIVNAERNMDLLLGLLVHIAWYHYHWRTYHTHMYMLLQMATMTIVDLGLDRCESFRMQPIPFEPKDLEDTQGQGYYQASAGQRAVIGCYFLCSRSSIFRHQFMLRRTQWIEHCAEALTKKFEYSSDALIKTYVDILSLTQQAQYLFEDEIPTPARGTSWKVLFKSMKTKQLEMEHLLPRETTNDNWALRLEIAAIPTLVLGQALRRQRDVFLLHSMNELQTLTVSAHNIVSVFLATPLTVTIHLPASVYTTLWYGLLVLSKLSLLFNDRDEFIGVSNRSIRDTGLAIMLRIGELSRVDDFWANCRRIIGSMLSWLENSTRETSHQQLREMPLTPSAGMNCSEHTDPALWHSQQSGVTGTPHPYDTWPTAQLAMQNSPSMYRGAQLQDACDANLWEQMLEGFTWFGPSVEVHL